MGPHNIAALGDGLTVICGPNPPDDNTLRSERLQVLHWRVDTPFTDPVAHRHTSSDEVYIVIDGILTLDIERRDGTVGPDRSCAVPAGVVHAVIAVHPPARGLTIRGPAIPDKRTVPLQGPEL